MTCSLNNTSTTRKRVSPRAIGERTSGPTRLRVVLEFSGLRPLKNFTALPEPAKAVAPRAPEKAGELHTRRSRIANEREIAGYGRGTINIKTRATQWQPDIDEKSLPP